MTGLNIAVKLYTVRGLTAVDFSGTVRRIAEIGYRNVELAGFGNLSSAREVRKVLDDHGVRAISAHYSMDMLEADAARIMDECAVLGNEYVVMPWLGEEQRPRDAAGWRGLADRLSRLGRQLADRGFRLAYHNHDFECEKFEGRPALDLLLERADEMAVFVELDVYWIAYTGYDPVAYIERHGRRMPLLHLKDMAAGPERCFAPIGAGVLDFRAILAAAGRNDVQWGIVEQDSTYETPPLEAIRMSFENLRNLWLFHITPD